ELGEHLGCFLDWCAHAASPPLGAQTGDEVVWRVLHHWSKVGGRPASKTSRCGCGQPFSRMQRSRIARVVATNDTALHPLLPPDPRRKTPHCRESAPGAQPPKAETCRFCFVLPAVIPPPRRCGERAAPLPALTPGEMRE